MFNEGATQLKALIKTLENRIDELQNAIKLQKEKIERQVHTHKSIKKCNEYQQK